MLYLLTYITRFTVVLSTADTILFNSWKQMSQLNLMLQFSTCNSSIQLEIDNGDELTGDFLYEEVHPKQHAHKQAFAKPKGPTGKRGGRRITRAPGDGGDDD